MMQAHTERWNLENPHNRHEVVQLQAEDALRNHPVKVLRYASMDRIDDFSHIIVFGPMGVSEHRLEPLRELRFGYRSEQTS